MSEGIDIEYIAQLARLDIPAEKLPALRKDMENIVGYIAELGELDVSGVEPTAHAVPLANVWREDVVKPSFDRDKMLANAPSLYNGEMVKLPKVLPGDEGSN